MGGFSPQVQSQQTSQPRPGGKGGMSSGPQDALKAYQSANKDIQTQSLAAQGQQDAIKQMGADFTNSATSGQPRIGAPNQYSNTVGMGDNTDQGANQFQGIGQGKGGGTNQPGSSGKGAAGKGA